jgi:hypothetical protein
MKLKLGTTLERAAATRRAAYCVLRAACIVSDRFFKGRPGGEGARSGVLPASDTREEGGGETRETRERGPEAEIRPLPYRS